MSIDLFNAQQCLSAAALKCIIVRSEALPIGLCNSVNLRAWCFSSSAIQRTVCTWYHMIISLYAFYAFCTLQPWQTSKVLKLCTCICIACYSICTSARPWCLSFQTLRASAVRRHNQSGRIRVQVVQVVQIEHFSLTAYICLPWSDIWNFVTCISWRCFGRGCIFMFLAQAWDTSDTMITLCNRGASARRASRALVAHRICTFIVMTILTMHDCKACCN